MKDIPKIKCACCAGTGQVDLPVQLCEMLAVLRKNGIEDGMSAPQIHRKVKYKGKSPTAINRRLEFLRNAGLLGRMRHGKEWFYYTVKN